MTYHEFVAEFQTRVLAALTSMQTTLSTSGVSNITIEEVDHKDLRYRLTARRGNRTLVCYFELTSVPIPGQLIITLFVEGNGSEITHLYTAVEQVATDDRDALLAKLTQAEETMAEITVKGRAFLQV